MADPSPADAPAGQEPEASEGQEPEATPEEEKGQPKTYPESYVRQLRREASGYRGRLAELEEQVQEFADKDKSEQERLAEKAATAEQRAAEAEIRLLRYEVATEHGLDMQAAAFLTGSTREELELRAEELGKLLDKAPKPSAGFDGGARTPAPVKGAPEEEHNDFLLRALGRAPR